MKKVTLLLAAAAMLFVACCNKQEATQADLAEVVMQNILSRKSVRSYTGDTIPAAVMENILRAAMAAPSGMDIRPWTSAPGASWCSPTRARMRPSSRATAI